MKMKSRSALRLKIVSIFLRCTSMNSKDIGHGHHLYYIRYYEKCDRLASLFGLETALNMYIPLGQ